MTRSIITPLLILFASFAYAGTESQTAKTMQFFLDACWNGKFLDGNDAYTKDTDTHCYRKMTNGHFVRDNHMVKSSRGTYGGETIFWWDAKEEVIKYHYFDTSGGMSSGMMSPTENGFVAPDETYEGQDGSKMVIRTQWTIKSGDRYLMESLKVSGDATTRMFAIDYQKAPLADCPGPGCSR